MNLAVPPPKFLQSVRMSLRSMDLYLGAQLFHLHLRWGSSSSSHHHHHRSNIIIVTTINRVIYIRKGRIAKGGRIRAAMLVASGKLSVMRQNRPVVRNVPIEKCDASSPRKPIDACLLSNKCRIWKNSFHRPNSNFSNCERVC